MLLICNHMLVRNIKEACKTAPHQIARERQGAQLGKLSDIPERYQVVAAQSEGLCLPEGLREGINLPQQIDIIVFEKVRAYSLP